MKKTLLILSAIVLFFAGCKKDTLFEEGEVLYKFAVTTNNITNIHNINFIAFLLNNHRVLNPQSAICIINPSTGNITKNKSNIPNINNINSIYFTFDGQNLDTLLYTTYRY